MRLLPLLIACTPVSALAQTITCTFASECIAGEECNDTDYSLSVTVNDFSELNGGEPLIPVGIAPLRVSDLNGDFDAMPLPDDQDEIGGFLAYQDDGIWSLLTQHQGDARYAVHMHEADLTITYTGTCEATE